MIWQEKSRKKMVKSLLELSAWHVLKNYVGYVKDLMLSQSLGFSVVCLCTQSFDFAKFATMKWTCTL